MAGASVADAAAFLAGWLTPTSLFILLNVIVVAIAAISLLGSSSSHRQHQNQNDNKKQHHELQQQQQYPLARAPSLFTRVTSFNLSHFHPHNHHDHALDLITETERLSASETSFQAPTEARLQRAPSLLSRLASLDLFVHRSGKSDTVRVPPPAESSESVMSGEDDGGNGARKAHVTRTRSEPKKRAVAGEEVRMRKSTSEKAVNEQETAVKEEEEVDAKADDFINRFKHQLKLQRLESMLRNRNVSASAAVM
ncbi:hypothetical protein Droror1_Dr00007206 [Drosera rotundifolia]